MEVEVVPGPVDGPLERLMTEDDKLLGSFMTEDDELLESSMSEDDELLESTGTIVDEILDIIPAEMKEVLENPVDANAEVALEANEDEELETLQNP